MKKNKKLKPGDHLMAVAFAAILVGRTPGAKKLDVLILCALALTIGHVWLRDDRDDDATKLGLWSWTKVAKYAVQTSLLGGVVTIPDVRRLRSGKAQGR
jgi:hypothetical protein